MQDFEHEFDFSIEIEGENNYRHITILNGTWAINTNTLSLVYQCIWICYNIMDMIMWECDSK